jgi:hypothetical protein
MEPMSMGEAEAFVAGLPWRQVRGTPEGPAHRPPDRHSYVIAASLARDDRVELARFVALIKTQGYRARYRPPYDPDQVMVNHYLALPDGRYYWYVGNGQLCRSESRQHEPLPPTPAQT